MTLHLIHALTGFLVGWVVNYLADVLPLTRKFSVPECPNCRQSINFKEYLFSPRCKHCQQIRTVRFWIVLLFCLVAALLVGFFPLGQLDFWSTLPLILFLGVIVVIDIEHHAVLIETSILGLILFFFYGWLLQGVLLTAIGGVVGFMVMLILYLAGVLYSKRASRNNPNISAEPGLGFGDVYACAFLGFFTGWPTVIGMIIFAIVLSGVYSILYLLIKSIRKEYQPHSTIPYAPFLVIGALLVYYLPGSPI